MQIVIATSNDQVGSNLARNIHSRSNHRCPYLKSHPVPPDLVFQDHPWSFKKKCKIFHDFSRKALTRFDFNKLPRRLGSENHDLNRPPRAHPTWQQLSLDAGTTMFGCDWGTLQTISSQGVLGRCFCLGQMSCKKCPAFGDEKPKFESSRHSWMTSQTPGHDEVQLCLRCIKLDAWRIRCHRKQTTWVHNLSNTRVSES